MSDALDPRTVWRLVLLLTLVPLVISAVFMAVTVGNSYHPWGDWAGMEMLVRDVGHHPVLIGLYSRDSWSHPGPILFYLLAVPYRLTGDSSVGLQLGALVINGSAIVGMAVLARRRGGTPLLLCTLVGCALLVRTLGPTFVRDPWVCYVTVFPFGLMVLLSWSMACGDAWALPVGAGVASFLAQTHIAYAALAGPLLIWGALWLVVLALRARHVDEGASPTIRAVGRAGIISAVVVLVLWLPPIIDELFSYHSPGNLSQILHWFQKGQVHTLVEGYRIVGAQFGSAPDWLIHAHRPGLFGVSPFAASAPVPVLLVLVGVAGFVLWARRGSQAGLLVATLGVALLAGVIAVARTVGVQYDYRLRWTWTLGMLGLVVVAWAAWLLVSARWSGAGRALVPVALCALVVLSITNSVTAARARIDPVHRAASAALGRFGPQILRTLPDRPGDVIIRAKSPRAGYYKSGLVVLLEREGIAARVDDNPGDFYGKSRAHHHGPVRAAFTVAIDDDFDKLAAKPGRLRLLGYDGTHSRTERARLLRESATGTARLDALRRAGKIDAAAYVRQKFALPNPGSAVGVFESPGGSNG